MSSCFVPGCKTGYPSQRKSLKRVGEKTPSLFGCKTEEELECWNKVVPQPGRPLTIRDKVCELHFEEKDIVRSFTHKFPDGSTQTVDRERPWLKPGSIPTIYLDFSESSSKKYTRRRKPRVVPILKKHEMPVKCAVSVCKNQHIQTKRQGQDIRYVNFPRDRRLKEIWIDRCDRDAEWKAKLAARGADWKPCRICSVHFTDDDYERDSKAELLGATTTKVLKKTAIPSLFLSKDYSEEDKARVEPEKPHEFQQIVNQLVNIPPRSYGKKNLAMPSSSSVIAIDSIKVEPMDQVEDSSLDVQVKIKSILSDVPDNPVLSNIKKEPIDDTEVLPSVSQSIPATESSSSFMLSVKSENTASEDCMDEITIPVNPTDVAPQVTLSGTSDMISFPCTNNTDPPFKISDISHMPNEENIVVPEGSPTSGDNTKPSKMADIFGSKQLVLTVPESSTMPHAFTNNIKPNKIPDILYFSNSSTLNVPESSRMLHTSTEGTKAPTKMANISSSTNNTDIKDEFSVFGDFMAAKIRGFKDRRLQVEAQHLITNLLSEMEIKDIKNSLPVISEISSLQTPSHLTGTFSSSSDIS